jgi:hypothetical protein
MQTYLTQDHLIPVVIATCPRRLNQPVIHDASGALLGLESIAAQKYGPPDVGWALQTIRDLDMSIPQIVMDGEEFLTF